MAKLDKRILKKIVKKCNQCGKEFETYKSNPQKYCNKICFLNKIFVNKIKMCKQCKKEFSTYKNYRIFCSIKCSHENKIIHKLKNCKECETEFKPQNHTTLYCSKKCLHAKTRVIVACKQCKKEFSTYKNKRRIFCSIKCHVESKLREVKICAVCKKEFTNRKKSVKCCSVVCGRKLRTKNSIVVVQCKYCEKDIKKYQKNIKKSKSGNFYCSKECVDNDKRGTNALIYKNNKRESRHIIYSDYRKWQSEVYKRDNYTCKICGATDKRIIARHLIPVADNSFFVTNIKNGIVLCHPCHQYLHHGIDKLITNIEVLISMKDEFINAKNARLRGNRKDYLIAWSKVKCNQCDTLFYKTKGRINITNHNFCSRQCAGKFKCKFNLEVINNCQNFQKM